MNRPFRVAAIVVSYNGVRFLKSCLPSIGQQAMSFYRVIVVDGGSSDATREYVDSRKNVELIQLPSNPGFARGANEGIRKAMMDPGVEAIALINNDVTLGTQWLEQAEAMLASDPSFGSCATCLLKKDRPDTIDSAGIVWASPGFADNYMSGERLASLNNKPHSVFGASAGAGLFRREMFEEVGLFDESLFCYQEDVDLALRAERKGWKCICAPGARGLHAGLGSNRPFPLGGTWADYYNARNCIFVQVKSLSSQEWKKHWREILWKHLHTCVRSLSERRSGAVLSGTLHGILRIPSALRKPKKAQLPEVFLRNDFRNARVSFGDSITAFFITKNAGGMLPGAIESLPGDTPVIVADALSEDDTVAVARSFGAKVVEQDLESIEASGGVFDIARNAAGELAQTPWILFLDSDERLSRQLIKEIDKLIAKGEDVEGFPEAFNTPRINLFWGKPVRLLGEDRQIRLVRKGRFVFPGAALHEKPVVQGKIGFLQSPIIHYNIQSWSDVLRRLRQYVLVEGRSMGKRPSLYRALSTPVHMFRYYYFQNEAWKDGWRGLLVSLVYAFYHGAVAWSARKNFNA